MNKLLLVFLLTFVGIQVSAKSLRIALSNTRMPYINPDDGSGAEIEILKAIFKKMEYKLIPVYVGTSELPTSLENMKIDAAGCLFDLNDPHIYYSDSYISYKNKVISLKKRALNIKTIKDISKHSVAAFGNAKHYIGGEYKLLVARSRNYTEYNDQSIQLKLLYQGRVDLVVMDYHFFKYNSQKIKNLPDLDVSFADVLIPTKYGVAFKDAKIRNAFNKALKSIRDDGTYKKIADLHGLDEK
jgi:polar amino acid transport system substrate-binding protein